MSKVSIVGSNGYIARNLFYHLSQRGDIEQITLYDCLDESVDKNEKYFKVNLLDRDDVKKIDFDCDIIFFMAGKTGTFSGFNNYADFISVNEFGLLNFIDEYRIQGSKAKIIFPSTRLVYKGSDIPVSEDSPIELKTIYAVNKFACENYLKQYSQIFGIKYCVFRICVPYGTRIQGASSYGTVEFMTKQAVNDRRITLYGDGSIRRTWTHIDDLCCAMICGAYSDKCLNDIYNIGGDDLSLKDVANMICREYDAELKYVPWPDQALCIESGSTVFDASKFAAVTGFKYMHQFQKWGEG